ncbi:TIGR03086 family protein [Rhodococcus sp. ABRD24]|uniref:TIGR03086 family metal-binding protein n=1 Tax=Rhodococcus sp. ABRD24 TaxID=2507582 RepID=UPI00104050C5|nr:TIGR03086 family metal-binding protein [Rhodococcus sp. ABRD24]QBJ97065.1 TIGR03086 family protein [Rhodococcus sp. ABRD24]
MTTPADPRPLYRQALHWTASVMAAVRTDQWSNPTPCSEFDARTLAGHLVATVDRVRVIGEGGDPLSVALVADGIPDNALSQSYRQAAHRLGEIWDDDAILDEVLTAPWGRISGREAVWAYPNETLVHGWDLAVATGQRSEADPELAETMLVAAYEAIPETPRGQHIPFDAVVRPRDDAGPTERLANWSGRDSTLWLNRQPS